MEIGYKTRKLSTENFLDDFDPPLVFHIKRRASEGWIDLIDGITESQDVALARQVMTGICYSVSDGNDTASVDEFYNSLKSAAPGMADELFCDLAYALGIEFLRETRRRIRALKKTQPASNGIVADQAPVLESSAS